MTLNDIGRMLKLAKVPRSKVVQLSYPNPGFVLHTPATHYMILANVVGNLKLRTDNVKVVLLDSKDVRDGEHVLVKVTGETNAHTRYSPECETSAQQRRTRQLSVRARNAGVTVECLSVVL